MNKRFQANNPRLTLNPVFVQQGNVSFGYDKQGNAGPEEIAVSAALMAFGIPVPPQVVAEGAKAHEKNLQRAKDLWAKVRGTDKKNTDLVPGGVVYFWKWFPFGPNYKTPIVNEPMTLGYFDQYQKDMKEELGGLSYTDAETLFKSSYAHLVKLWESGTIPVKNEDQKPTWEFLKKLDEEMKAKGLKPEPQKESESSGTSGTKTKDFILDIANFLLGESKATTAKEKEKEDKEKKNKLLIWSFVTLLAVVGLVVWYKSKNK